MKQIPKSVENTHTHTYTKVCENKETDSPSGIYRMKLLGTCSLLKETPEKKKNGTPIFWEWDSYFLAGTPTFYTRIPRKASSHLLGQKSQKPQSECGY